MLRKGLFVSVLIGVSMLVGVGCMLVDFGNSEVSEKVEESLDRSISTSIRNLSIRFAELDASIASVEGLIWLDSIAELCSEELYERTYVNGERMYGLPDTNSVDFVSAKYVTVGLNLDNEVKGKYVSTFVTQENIQGRVYYYTCVLGISEDMLVDDYIKIAHLK